MPGPLCSPHLRLWALWLPSWLTKLFAPIVMYSPEAILRRRAPWDIPSKTSASDSPW